MGDRVDNYKGTVNDDDTFSLINETHVTLPTSRRTAAYNAAIQGQSAFDAFIAAETGLPQAVRDWHASLDANRRQGRRLAMVSLGPSP